MRGTPSPEAVRWRIPSAVPALKLAGAAAVGLLGLVFGDDPTRLVLAGATAVGLVVWAARDLVAPVRLAADPAGVEIISGYARRRVLPWDRIERIRVDVRPRLGLRTETLEIDTGDTVHLFGPYDLNAPPAEVAARLNQLSRSGGQGPGEAQQ